MRFIVLMMIGIVFVAIWLAKRKAGRKPVLSPLVGIWKKWGGNEELVFSEIDRKSGEGDFSWRKGEDFLAGKWIIRGWPFIILKLEGGFADGFPVLVQGPGSDATGILFGLDDDGVLWENEGLGKTSRWEKVGRE